jgi:hypothetical protein
MHQLMRGKATKHLDGRSIANLRIKGWFSAPLPRRYRRNGWAKQTDRLLGGFMPPIF